MATDKNILFKGIRYLFGALPLLVIGPIVINSAFKNEKSPLYLYVLTFGVIVALAAMFLIFKGVTTLVKSLFDGDKNQKS